MLLAFFTRNSHFSLRKDEDQAFVLEVINNITTGLSFLGIAYFYYLYRKVEHKSLITRLVSNLILSDLVYSFANFLSNFDNNHNVCVTEGFMREYSQLTTLFWSMTLAYSAFAQTVWGKRNLEDKIWIMKILGYFIPLLISIVPFIPYSNIQYGKMWVYCWIVHDPPGTELPRYVSLAMLLGYIWLAIVLVTYWYARIYFFARSMQCGGVSAKKLFLYPLALLISFFPVIIDSFLSTTSFDFISAVLHMATQHSLGFLNAITYGLQATTSARTQRNSQPESKKLETEKTTRADHPSLNYTVKSSDIYQDNEDFDDIRSYSLTKELLNAHGDS